MFIIDIGENVLVNGTSSMLRLLRFIIDIEFIIELAEDVLVKIFSIFCLLSVYLHSHTHTYTDEYAVNCVVCLILRKCSGKNMSVFLFKRVDQFYYGCMKRFSSKT